MYRRSRIQDTRDNKYSRQILHFDGDSFFASVEQVLNYELKGKPLVTGSERGVITSASIEAKRFGINRGVSMRQAKEICPDLIIVPGNYLMYSIFASRMYSIVREFTDKVEEYSIDECFADISYTSGSLGPKIKERLENSLGVTFGVGLAPTKVLAKVASKHRKPGGYTEITDENIDSILGSLPCGRVWGIGPAASFALSKLGVKTAKEFRDKSIGWIEANRIAKPLREIWLELKGNSVKDLCLIPEAPHSIVKSRTFRPSTSLRSVILSELSSNVESAMSKMRGYRMRTKEFRFYLKTQEFRYHGFDVLLPMHTSSTIEIMKHIKANFDKVYAPKTVYRATGICLKNFSAGLPTPDLFGEIMGAEKQAVVFKAVDKINSRFGDRSLILGSSLSAINNWRERPSKTLDLPFLGVAR